MDRRCRVNRAVEKNCLGIGNRKQFDGGASGKRAKAAEARFDCHETLSRGMGVACDNMYRISAEKHLRSPLSRLPEHARETSRGDLEQDAPVDEIERTLRIALNLFVALGMSEDRPKSRSLDTKERFVGMERPTDERHVD